MKKALAFVLAFTSVVSAAGQQVTPRPVPARTAASPPEIKLVLLIAVDQFR